MKVLGAIIAVTFAWSAWAKQQDSVVKIEAETKALVVTKELPYKTEYVVSRDVGRGRVLKAQEGKKGSETVTYEVLYVNGKESSRKAISKDRVEPQNEIFKIGKEGYGTSRGAFTGRKIITVVATAYHPMAGVGAKYGGKTASGIMAKYGVIAVDPKVIKLGTWVYVEGYGLAIAADTGGAIKGNRIDVCLTNERDIDNWGRKKVKVHILSDR
ncbi:MAG: G5 domain-containing protein [Armatimonadetes bacterium]|nr:G5 domain-containing protein [Armatimonadota bacterium]